VSILAFVGLQSQIDLLAAAVVAGAGVAAAVKEVVAKKIKNLKLSFLFLLKKFSNCFAWKKCCIKNTACI